MLTKPSRNPPVVADLAAAGDVQVAAAAGAVTVAAAVAAAAGNPEPGR